jgi:hypothetical protein
MSRKISSLHSLVAFIHLLEWSLRQRAILLNIAKCHYFLLWYYHVVR